MTQWSWEAEISEESTETMKARGMQTRTEPVEDASTLCTNGYFPPLNFSPWYPYFSLPLYFSTRGDILWYCAINEKINRRVSDKLNDSQKI